MAVPVIGFSSILTTVLSASLRSGHLSADSTKSSVLISSTFFVSPVANCTKDPLVKLFCAVVLVEVFLGDSGGEVTALTRFRAPSGLGSAEVR